MRWRNPKHDERRVRSGFLWLPKHIGDETRWLERATWEERYDTMRPLGSSLPPRWRAVAWLDSREARDA